MITVYEIGALCGASVLGLLSDLMGGRRPPVLILSLTISGMILYIITFNFMTLSTLTYSFLLFVLGVFLGSLTHMLCITCTSDLGTKKGNNKTGAVTGIIDGIGSFGQSVGQLIIGYTIDHFGWTWGYMFMLGSFVSLTIIPLLDMIRIERKKNRINY